MITPKTPKIIAFDRRKLFGDIMVSIPALYLAKRIYPSAKLILITNARGKNLCKNFDFIDEIVELEAHSDDFGAIIEKIAPDILILGHRTAQNIDFAYNSKCPKIISWLHLKSMLLPRFCHPKYLYKGRRREITACIDLIRAISPRRFDRILFNKIFGDTRKISLQNLPIRITPSPANVAFVDRFIDVIGGGLQGNYRHSRISWQKLL